MSIVSVYCKCLLRVSIVSVYCKCLLRLSIVSVYCQCLLCFRSNMLKNHVFYTVPLGNDETAWVVLRFRSKMLLFECVLLCFCSHMCKKHYKTLLRIVFVHMNSPNPCIYRCNFLLHLKQNTFLTFMEKPERNENSPGGRRPAGQDVASRFVCVSVYSPL